jgi:aminopeptidase N
MRAFFDQWVFGAGFPEYKVSYSFDDKQKMATVKVSQTQKLENETGLFAMPIELSFDFADGTNKLVTVTVDEKEHSFSFHLDQKPKMFRFDPSNWVLKSLELDVPKGMLIHQVNNDASVMGRIYAAKALANKFSSGDDVVKILEDAAKSDFFWGVAVESVNLLGTLKTPAAKKALMRLARVKNASVEYAKVRRSVVTALGNFESKKVGKLLAEIITSGKEQSKFVLADAAAAIGRTKWKGALAVLKQASTMDSWNEIVRIGALNGLAALGHTGGTEVASELALAGKPWHSRPAAIACLGSLAASAKKDDALKALHKLAQSDEGSQFTLRMSIVNALGQAKKAESLAILDKLEKSSFDGRVKRLITETATSIRESTKSGHAKSAAAADKVDQKKLGESVAKLTTELAVVSKELKKLRKQSKQ